MDGDERLYDPKSNHTRKNLMLTLKEVGVMQDEVWKLCISKGGSENGYHIRQVGS